jgi:hypothetical protein
MQSGGGPDPSSGSPTNARRSFAALGALRPLADHALADRRRNDSATLVACRMRKCDDALSLTALRLPLFSHDGLGIQRVAVQDGTRKVVSPNPRLATIMPRLSCATDRPTRVDNVSIELTTRWR